MTDPDVEIRAAVERYATAWSNGDLAAMVACYHEKFALHYFGSNVCSGDHLGKEAALATLTEFSRRTGRRLVSILATLAGTKRGAIVVREILGNGPQAVEVERVLIYAVQDGLLKDCWVYDQDQRFIDTIVGPPS